MSTSSGVDYGRALFERLHGRQYLPVRSLQADEAARNDPRLYAWFDSADWGLVPDLRDRRVAIVGNTEVFGQGRSIDAHDDVIRMNRMGHWKHAPEDDGTRVTIWAGLPWAITIPNDADRVRAAPYLPSCFPEIAPQLSLIWSATPFHLSARFMDFLWRKNLSERLFISGGGLHFHDFLVGKLPPAIFRELYSIRPDTLPQDVPNHLFNFDLMLTGVRIAFLCALAKASDIGLFGFDFFEGSERRPWGGHDLAFDRGFLSAVVELAATWNTRIRIF